MTFTPANIGSNMVCTVSLVKHATVHTSLGLEVQPAFAKIDQAIVEALKGVTVVGKMGKRILHPKIGSAIKDAGFVVDYEDTRGFLAAGLPVWRSKDNGLIEGTSGRRLVDLVVYDLNDGVVALVEIESELGDLKAERVTKRNGHYDVFSIAQNASGFHFDSYKSLERMAAAAFYHSSGADKPTAIAQLSALSSNDPRVRNPTGLGLFLVSGKVRPQDPGILRSRLLSLNAVLRFPSDSSSTLRFP
jgi:hypothetical protein